jgi:nitroimidazol reductase NimA-like FMN-containing flavoprotein (pyridoxamine 5'-phosphate oxidase superfamily)
VAVADTDVRALIALQEASYARAGRGLRSSWPREQAMAAAPLRAFLEARRYGVLATARADGRPQAAPISFLVRAGSFWFATVAGARLRNLHAQPYASLVVSDGEEGAHRVVMAEGGVRLHEPTAALASEWALRHGSDPAWAAAYVELVPERVFSYAALPD